MDDNRLFLWCHIFVRRDVCKTEADVFERRFHGRRYHGNEEELPQKARIQSKLEKKDRNQETSKGNLCIGICKTKIDYIKINILISVYYFDV